MSWLPIESAPSFTDTPPRCLVYSPEFGVQVGAAWSYPDGAKGARADGFHGDWEITHWMPLPEPPTDDRWELTEAGRAMRGGK